MKACKLHCYWYWKNGWLVCCIRAYATPILSVSMDHHEMQWPEAALVLLPLCKDLKPEDLLRPFLLMWVKTLNFPESSSARLGLGVFSIVSPLGFKPSLAHLHLQVAAICKPFPKGILPGLVLKVFINLIVKLFMILDKVQDSLLIRVC